MGRQNINRFASPKNLRLINSIRDSCKSIEELDLGGNKFNDLIEVYKILQCTPNLKFLNLSENDLSRTSPVAMASNSNCLPGASTNHSPLSFQLTSSNLNNTHTLTAQQHNWSASSMALNSNSRAYLAPINQNNSQQCQHLQGPTIGARRHSTLGNNLTGANSNSAANRVGRQSTSGQEARRMASAAAAVAQSKKTSSSVASKLAASSRVGAKASGQLATTSRDSNRHHPRIVQELSKSSQLVAGSSGAAKSDSKARGLLLNGRQATPTSTMNLARSLSSLSAKDVRNQLSSHQRLANNSSRQHQKQEQTSSCGRQQLRRSTTSLGMPAPTSGAVARHLESANKSTGITSGKEKTSLSLVVEPIAETDNDIDMTAGDLNSQSPPANTGNNNTQSSSQTINHNNQQQQRIQTTGSNNNKLFNYSSQSSNNYYRRTFNSIKALALNNTGCQWKVVCSILNRMPNLEELHLSLNNYGSIDLDPIEFKHNNLKRLYLCNNPKLTNWRELDKLLLAFPSLEALSIADCNISQIPDNLDRAREWRKLCGLNINGWPIKDWSVIERLNQLPSLSDLKCRNLEILNSIDEPRHHLIARLPKLQKLNGSEIEEREHAEKAFLRFFMANSHLERPSRFHELVQIHGEIIPVDVDVDLSPPSQASVRVVYFNRNYYMKENGDDDIIMSEDFLTKLMDNVEPNNSLIIDGGNATGSSSMEIVASSTIATLNNDETTTQDEMGNKLVRLFKDEGQEVLAIQVDLRQSVRKFKSTLGQLFGLNSQNLILYYIDHEMVGLMGPELIKHNQKKLWNYNVQDGDQFIVEER